MSAVFDGDRTVHYPNNPDCFQFDAEVAGHFEEMAVRSIPMYEEAHRLHISLFREEIFQQGDILVYDVGASRGRFFKQLCNEFRLDWREGSPKFDCVAIDNSFDMLQLLRKEMPWVRTVEADASRLIDMPMQADYICMFYLLQFLPTNGKLAALKWAYNNLKQGGVLFLGQKEKELRGFESCFSEEYYRLRMRNGYSREEIEAKTKALAGAMWTLTKEDNKSLAHAAGFDSYIETTRWLQFSTAFCVK